MCRIKRPTRSARGFTLVELLAVAVIIGLLGAVTIPALSGLGQTRSAAAAERMARDLTFARERSTALALTTWVVFSVGGQSYSVLAENPSSPGRAGAAVINDPATQQSFVQTLNRNDAVGVALTAVDLAGLSEVGFDRLGRPMRTNGTAWTTEGTITLSGGWTVRIAPRTGLARVTSGDGS